MTWTVRPGRRIGLVGPNGAGKSTLLKLIDGHLSADSGTVTRPAGSTVGYLRQDIQELDLTRTVLEEAMTAFNEVLALEEREQALTRQLSEATDYEGPAYAALLHDLEEVHARLAGQESHMIEPTTRTVLAGLGFATADMDRPVGEFSGGWRMRVALAQLLLRTPDYLLLDEPTNHLDIDSIDWLEGYLSAYRGAVVIVSHDRYFLDRMVNETAELEGGRVTVYAGNYAFYLEERTVRRDHQQAMFDNQQKEIAQAERFIQRFRAKATKARQVQSRVKALERMERLAPPPADSPTIRIRFPDPPRSGKVVLNVSRFSKQYEGEDGIVPVFDRAGPLTIERGDRIALIGRNGAGKSTLARILYGSEPFDGEREPGHQMTVSFFAQHQAETLRATDTLLESMRSAARGHTETELRTILGAFLFSEDDVEKRVGVLSGGEKNRLALAHSLLSEANFRILDEPTNHLDLQSISVLVEALKHYKGTFVLVSHNRHFLDQVATKVWRVEDGTVRQYIGNYSDYQWQMRHGTRRTADAATTGDGAPSNSGHGTSPPLSRSASRKPGPDGRPGPSGAPGPVARTAAATEPVQRGDDRREKKRREAEERRRVGKANVDELLADLDGLGGYGLQKLHRKLEQRIFKAERRQRVLEKELADPAVFNDFDRARETTLEYEDLKNRLSTLYQQWEAVGERLE